MYNLKFGTSFNRRTKFLRTMGNPPKLSMPDSYKSNGLAVNNVTYENMK